MNIAGGMRTDKRNRDRQAADPGGSPASPAQLLQTPTGSAAAARDG
jgi:hypothetical protein